MQLRLKTLGNENGSRVGGTTSYGQLYSKNSTKKKMAISSIPNNSLRERFYIYGFRRKIYNTVIKYLHYNCIGYYSFCVLS